MSKFVQAFLSGLFFTFILDFFIFLGIKLHYVDLYEIDVYYNILFADHQNIYVYMFFTAVLGYMFTYLENTKFIAVTYATLFLLVSLTLFESVGNKVGKMLLMKENITLKSKKHTFRGDIYYDGRKKITFYDYELKKIILLNKKDLEL
ncbi:hypothetical protein KJ877_09055 [bacterium]|nr:hypothetical protein [bacterium]MBU1990846.1 hypothetical protein [bacterium]